MAKKLILGVLISGRGSNLQAIMDAIQKGGVNARIAVVISNEPQAQGLVRAKARGIRAVVVPHRDFDRREDFEDRLIGVLKEHQVGLVVLAGFMRVLTGHFLQAFPNQVINIHPALLPAFPGLDVQAKAVAYGVRFSGCTVHFVNEGVDAGPIIAQAVVPVFPEDTGEVLAERILRMEHRLFPRVIQWFAEDRVRLEGRRVVVKGAEKRETLAWMEPAA